MPFLQEMWLKVRHDQDVDTTGLRVPKFSDSGTQIETHSTALQVQKSALCGIIVFVLVSRYFLM